MRAWGAERGGGFAQRPGAVGVSALGGGESHRGGGSKGDHHKGGANI